MANYTSKSDLLIEAVIPNYCRPWYCVIKLFYKRNPVPLVSLSADWLRDLRILVLETRRLAARSTAERMLTLLGQPAGQTAGYRRGGINLVSAH